MYCLGLLHILLSSIYFNDVFNISYNIVFYTLYVYDCIMK